MKKLLLCTSLIALFGANAEAIQLVNNLTSQASVVSIYMTARPSKTLKTVTLNPGQTIDDFDITKYFPPATVRVEFEFGQRGLGPASDCHPKRVDLTPRFTIDDLNDEGQVMIGVDQNSRYRMAKCHVITSLTAQTPHKKETKKSEKPKAPTNM